MTTRLYMKIAAMLSVITVLSLGITALIQAIPRKSDDAFCVVTSFYPVYIAARNVVGDTDDVAVVNMVDSQGGCLHDYQMSPRDRAVLERADVFVMNGAGAEPFLTAALQQLPDLTVADLSAGAKLVESRHVHGHDDHEEHGHDEAEDADVNGHLWVSPLRYRQQIQTLCEALVKADPAHADSYRRNTEAYIEKIDAVWARMQAAVKLYVDMPTVLFHDSLVYLAEDLDLNVVASLNIGEESGLSAAEKAAATDALKGANTALFLYDSQYTTDIHIEQHVKTTVKVTVDTAVTGENSTDAWLLAMTALCETWEANYA